MNEVSQNRRLSAPDFAYQTLKNQIINGTLAPDQPIVEQTLSEKLEVSRTPLREAIQRLEYEDLLTRRNNGRLKVSSISIKEVEEIFIVRSKLEAVAVEQAIDNMTKADEEKLSHLTLMIEEMSKQKVIEEVVNYGEQFHKYIYQLSNNQTVIKILLQLKDHIDRYRRLIPLEKSHKSKYQVNDHRLILNFMIDRNKDEAKHAMEEHIITSMHSIVRKVKEDSSLP